MQLKETSRTRNLEKAWRPRQKSTKYKNRLCIQANNIGKHK